jgi:hypothetical protein
LLSYDYHPDEINFNLEGGCIMLIQLDNGQELEITRGSFVYTKDSNGVDSYTEWKDLSVADQRKFESIVDDFNVKLGG